jgi:MFS family permease
VTAAAAQPRLRRAGAWRLLLFALLAQLGVSIVDQGIPTLTGFIKTELAISAATAGLAVASFSFGKFAGAYAAGLAADRFGERRVIVGGNIAVAVLVGCAVLSPLPLLFVLLTAAGVAASTSTPAGGRLVLLAFPRNRRGLALSIRQCGIPFGGLVAAATLPWIAHVASWRWSLAAAAGLTILLVIPLALARLEPGARPEVVPEPDRRGIGRDRNIVLLTVWSCLVVTGQYAILAFLALDFHGRAGLTLAQASLLVALANGVGIAGRVFWGALSDRILARGRKPVLLAVTTSAFASALLLFATPRSAPLGVLAAVAAFGGFALIGYQGLYITMVAELAGPARVGAATGFSVTFVQLAIAVTPPLYGLVADAAGTYRAIWAVLAGVLLVAFVPAALLRER